MLCTISVRGSDSRLMHTATALKYFPALIAATPSACQQARISLLPSPLQQPAPHTQAATSRCSALTAQHHAHQLMRTSHTLNTCSNSSSSIPRLGCLRVTMVRPSVPLAVVPSEQGPTHPGQRKACQQECPGTPQSPARLIRVLRRGVTGCQRGSEAPASSSTQQLLLRLGSSCRQ